MYFAAIDDQKVKQHEKNYVRLLCLNWNIKQPFKIVYKEAKITLQNTYSEPKGNITFSMI